MTTPLREHDHMKAPEYDDDACKRRNWREQPQSCETCSHAVFIDAVVKCGFGCWKVGRYYFGNSNELDRFLCSQVCDAWEGEENE